MSLETAGEHDGKLELQQPASLDGEVVNFRSWRPEKSTAPRLVTVKIISAAPESMCHLSTGNRDVVFLNFRSIQEPGETCVLRPLRREVAQVGVRGQLEPRRHWGANARGVQRAQIRHLFRRQNRGRAE